MPTDKAALSPERRGRYKETPDVAAGIERLIDAVGRRVADGDPEDLAGLVAIEQALAKAYRAGVDGLRASGRSDTEIGRALGVTRQAVAQRWPWSRDGGDRA